MKPGEKEIEWGLVEGDTFTEMLERSSKIEVLTTRDIAFHNFPLKMKVMYDDVAYGDLLAEKFYVTTGSHANVSAEMCFVRHQYDHGVELPFRNYGFVNSDDLTKAIVFAPSFGVFKSVVSGFASFCYQEASYFPVHGSVLSVDGRGILFIGGSMAGKTTTLINVVHAMYEQGRKVKVLGDDWSVVKWQADRSLIAETFDPSVSLRKRNLEENPHIFFSCHDWLVQQFLTRDKLSLSPTLLYGPNSATDSVAIDCIVLLQPYPGPCSLRKEGNEDIAKQIVHDAYHYPYITDTQREKHVDFWCDVQKQIEILCFNTRSNSGQRQQLAPIMEMMT